MSIESQLVHLGRWAIRSTQLIGYLPLSINTLRKPVQQSTLRFNLRFFPVITTSILLLLSTAWYTYYFSHLSQYLRFLKVRGPTEKYAYSVFVISTGLAGAYYRVAGILERKKTLSFWKDNCGTFERLEPLLGYSKRGLLEDEEFQRVKSNLKRSILANATFSGIHTLLIHGNGWLQALRVGNPKMTAFTLMLYFGAAFWAVVVLLHVVNTIWISFFIQIYTAGFLCIAKRIRALRDPWEFKCNVSSPKNDSVEVTGAGNNIFLPFQFQLNQCIEAFIILEKRVEVFNEFFGGKLIVEVLLCIIHLVVHLFFISLWLGRGGVSEIVSIIAYFLVNANQLQSLGTMAGEMTLATEAVAAAFIESITSGRINFDMQVKLEMLCSKIGSNPPVISARYFFVVNRHLVTSVLSAMTTFLVVLVQFRDADYIDMLAFRRNQTLTRLLV